MKGSPSTACARDYIFRSASIPIWAVLSSQLHINWSLEQLICRAVSPVSLYNEWRFSNIFQRLAVFKTPGDKMRPRFARIAATHFKMNDLPPLIARRAGGTGHASRAEQTAPSTHRQLKRETVTTSHRKHASSPSSPSLTAQRSHPYRPYRRL